MSGSVLLLSNYFNDVRFFIYNKRLNYYIAASHFCLFYSLLSLDKREKCQFLMFNVQ